MKNQYIPQFPKLFRDLLVENGITQQDLSNKTGIHKTQISQYCTGHRRPSLETLIKFADAITTEKRGRLLYKLIGWIREDIKKGGMSC